MGDQWELLHPTYQSIVTAADALKVEIPAAPTGMSVHYCLLAKIKSTALVTGRRAKKIICPYVYRSSETRCTQTRSGGHKLGHDGERPILNCPSSTNTIMSAALWLGKVLDRS